MENFIFKRDYSEQKRAKVRAFIDDPNFEKRYEEVCKDYDLSRQINRMIPKTINQEGKEAFDRILAVLDSEAQRMGGILNAVIDFENGEAKIEYLVPFFQICSESEGQEKKLLQDIMDNCSYILFGTLGGRTRIVVEFPYFDDCIEDMDEEAQSRLSELLESAK